MRHIIISLVLSVFFSNAYPMASKVNVEKAVDNAVERYGLRMEPHLKSAFSKAGVAYPPRDIALLAFKKERHIQLWAKNKNQSWRHVNTYPLTASSGRLGPKLKERDKQIPEGIYRLTAFNPFSAMHLSIMINYPNNWDRLQASKEGRNKLGGNIFLHGKSLSVGCLAVGDKAIDELFLLTRRVGLNHVQLIIAPNDLRKARPATAMFTQPRWVPALYQQIDKALAQFPLSRTA